jgi:hypothetical protein
MTEKQYVFVVESLGDDTPTLLSVHTTQEKAFEARDSFIKSYRYGGTADDYWVHGMKLDSTGVTEDEYE